MNFGMHLYWMVIVFCISPVWYWYVWIFIWFENNLIMKGYGWSMRKLLIVWLFSTWLFFVYVAIWFLMQYNLFVVVKWNEKSHFSLIKMLKYPLGLSLNSWSPINTIINTRLENLYSIQPSRILILMFSYQKMKITYSSVRFFDIRISLFNWCHLKKRCAYATPSLDLLM